MRGLAACLAGFLAVGALGAMVVTMSACSDSTDASGGAGGATAAGGSHSGGSATSGGGTSMGGSGPTCGFISEECNTCLVGKCKAPLGACSDDTACGEALGNLAGCVCNPSNDPEMCIGDFVTEQGDLGRDLAECYSLNCDTACE